jgi:DNA-binding NtrC family response regulator
MAERKRITLPGKDAVLVPVAPRALRLVATGRELPLPAEAASLRVGSDRGNEIIVDDRFVSRLHCTLEREDGRLLVRDRKSRNGTLVNGTPVRVGELRVGARLTIGETTLLVVGEVAAGRRSAVELLVSEDRAFRAALEIAMRAARSEAPIVILGESGTGKELVARLVHESSPRAAGPFVAVNCGAIARELVESELFGHERGAFTGAGERRPGYFEQAQSGTLFLDEIAELPLEQQPRLLRALETLRVRRLGGVEEILLDVRVVAATHRDLRAAVAERQFRADLYHRLAGVELVLPPLRERRADIPLLARRFLDDLRAELGERELGADALAALVAHDWPGNVRELRHAVQRAARFCDGSVLRPEDLLAHLARDRGLALVPADGDAAVPFEHAMRLLMVRAVERNPTLRGAAKDLGIAKSTLHDRLRRYGVKRPGQD